MPMPAVSICQDFIPANKYHLQTFDQIRTFKYSDIPLNFANKVKKHLKTISFKNIDTWNVQEFT